MLKAEKPFHLFRFVLWNVYLVYKGSLIATVDLRVTLVTGCNGGSSKWEV